MLRFQQAEGSLCSDGNSHPGAIQENRPMVGSLLRCQAFLFDPDQSPPIKCICFVQPFQGNFEPAPHSVRGKHQVDDAAELVGD
jgi:hypothetical protein